MEGSCQGNPSLNPLLFRSEIHKRNHRTVSELAENAAKELTSLSGYMSNLSDIDARTLALWLYYMELVDRTSPNKAQNLISKMFLVSPSTARRWATAWE